MTDLEKKEYEAWIDFE